MRLKELRLEKNLTQTELAKAINTSQRNIGRWENGLNEPTSSFVMQLATYLEVSADYLLGLEDDFGVRAAPIPNTGNESKLNEKEKALLEAFGKLLPETQDFILRSIQSFVKTDSAKKTIK